jgi:hypothetical protein
MAAKKFFVDLDLQKQSLKNAKLENVAVSGVSSPATGQVAFDTASSKMAFYNGSSWEVVGQLAVDTVNYKGGVAASGTVSNPDSGDMYIFTEAGTATNFGGSVVQAGDFAIYDGSKWDVIQKNVEAASTTVAGYVELADNDETITGTDSTRAVTPASLKAFQDQENKTLVRKRVYTGQNLSSPIEFTHGLGNSQVQVSVYDESDSSEVVVGVVKGNGTVTISSNIALTATVIISA